MVSKQQIALYREGLIERQGGRTHRRRLASRWLQIAVCVSFDDDKQNRKMTSIMSTKSEPKTYFEMISKEAMFSMAQYAIAFSEWQ